ncbi:MAG TPA: O-antigen ligase family protein [Gammaproteobacteria bacterium]|nr:O-antigen ligase family protein [Gammaproteobacteria bacterium]
MSEGRAVLLGGEQARWRFLWREWWPVLLIWSCLALLPFARSVEVPVVIMAGLGLRLLFKHGRTLVWQGPARLFSVVFFLFWVPALLALPDAVHGQKSLIGTLAYPRFYLAGLFILHVAARPALRRRLLWLSACLVLVWLADAVLQFVVGRDILGYEYVPGRLNALFGEESKRFGYVLVILVPLLFEYARRHWPRSVQAVVVLVTVAVVLLAGSRAAWITLFVIGVAYLVLHARARGAVPWRALGGFVLGVALILAAAYTLHEPFHQRLDKSLLVLQGDKASVDTAISHRLPIWTVAIAIYADHPVNGIGMHGFRYAYVNYAQPDDPFVNPKTGTGALHAHQLILEIAAETGSFGLVGFIIALFLVLRLGLRAPPAARPALLPWGLMLLALLFPLNTHVPAYSQLLSVLLWWATALFVASGTEGAVACLGGECGEAKQV